MFMGLVLFVSSCTSVYKQAPEQPYLTAVKLFMFKGFGAFSRFLYFRIQIGTKANLLNGGLVVYVHGFGVLVASCTSVYK